MPLALALFTGSLDSMLAVRALQEQGFEVEAIHLRTFFGCGHAEAESAAESLSIPLTTLDVGDDYLDVFRRPRFGFGEAKNPCIDCRVYLCRLAYRQMQKIDASLVISGEILGQRPQGQKRKDLEIIAHHSGLEDRLLRPLSAQLLPETAAERAGLVDRRRLFGFHGSGRRELVELAKRWRFPLIPSPSGGCAAAQQRLKACLRDLLEHDPAARREEFELLRIGRHFRFDGRTKIVLGRNETENLLLRQSAAKYQASLAIFLEPKNFTGPSALLVGPHAEKAIRSAGGLMLHYGRRNAVDNEIIAIIGEITAEFAVSDETDAAEPKRIG
jgi:tRNA-specific 2-thiouridylase